MNTSVLKISACLLIMIAGGSLSASAQSSATATASATIITPITITKTTDMNFGNVAVHATTAGTVVMTPASARSSTAGVTIPATSGTVAAASFNVGGQASYTYAITLPNNVTIMDNSSNTMTVDNFTSSPSAIGTLSGAGTQTLTVGATLNVTGGQAAGLYTSATPFTVTVNYN